MATLENLIGKPLHECSEQELNDLAMKGRIAREEESSGAKTRKKSAAPKVAKVNPNLVTVDLDELE